MIRYCVHCNHEIIKCPTNCRFRSWKHIDTGKHLCDHWNYRRIGPGRHHYTIVTYTAYPGVRNGKSSKV